MWQFLDSVKKHLVISIPAAMLLGLLWGQAGEVSWMKSAIYPLTFLMVYPMMVNLQLRHLFSHTGMKSQVAAQIINFGIIPFVGLGLGKLFFPHAPMVQLGLLLASLLPTSGMTISWTGLSHGNVNSAIKMTVIGLLLGSLATPFYAQWLMGHTVSIPLTGVFRQIALIVFLPMVLGVVTRRILVSRMGETRYNKELKMKFPALSTIGVLGIVLVAMALKSKSIMSHPEKLLTYLLPLILLYGINFLISTLTGKWLFKRDDAIALVYGTVLRNLSIALAIAMTVFQKEGAEIAIIIALAFIIQAQAAAWYVRFTDKIFGKAQ